MQKYLSILLLLLCSVSANAGWQRIDGHYVWVPIAGESRNPPPVQQPPDFSHLRLPRHHKGWQYDQKHMPTPAQHSSGTSYSINPIFQSDLSAQMGMQAFNDLFNRPAAPSYDHIRKAADEAKSQVDDLRRRKEAVEQQIEQSRATSSVALSLPSLDDMLSEFMAQEPEAPSQHINPDTIPDAPEDQLPYRVRSDDPELKSVYKDLYKIDPYFENRKQARQFGLLAVEEADSAAVDGHADTGFYKQLAVEFLDIAIGNDPVTGFGRSAYELFVGRNLVSGAKLSATERSFAFLGVATVGGSRWIGNAGRGMARVYERAAHLLHDRQAIQTALREGEQLVEKGGRMLQGWSKKHNITSFETALEANRRLGYTQSPYREGSHLVHFKTTGDQTFMRVHTNGVHSRPEGTWLVRKGEIAGLTPQQIADKLNLEHLPTHFTDVHIPVGTDMSRGLTNLNQWGTELSYTLEGQVQYRIETRFAQDWFRNTRSIGGIFR